MDNSNHFTVIEWDMLEKYKFYPLSGVGSFVVQSILHPIGLIRTRLVMQHNNELYNGMIHGARSILAKEGWRGLYNGFYVKSVQLLSGVAYVSTYEQMRYHLKHQYAGVSDGVRSFVAGGCASAVGQTLVVPVDVVSQHLMILNNRDRAVGRLSSVRLSDKELRSPLSRFLGVCRHILHDYGILGFYKGYLMSMMTFVPNGALWWFFYNEYCDCVSRVMESLSLDLPRLATQLTAAPLSGATAAIIMNPADCVRMRMQVSNRGFSQSVKSLWREEGVKLVRKGLSARLTQSITYSFWIMFTYEQIKCFCLKEQFRDRFKI